MSLSAGEMRSADRMGAEALLRTLGPGSMLVRWPEIVARPPPAGAMVLRGEDGSVFGFASYFPQATSLGEKVLIVDSFVTAEPFGRRRCRDLLSRALAEQAAASGCMRLSGLPSEPDPHGGSASGRPARGAG